MKKEDIKKIITNLTIPEFGQPTSPEEAIERRGYERARFMYAEEKLRVIESL